jgi:hypothetical protein
MSAGDHPESRVAPVLTQRCCDGTPVGRPLPRPPSTHGGPLRQDVVAGPTPVRLVQPGVFAGARLRAVPL